MRPAVLPGLSREPEGSRHGRRGGSAVVADRRLARDPLHVSCAARIPDPNSSWYAAGLTHERQVWRRARPDNAALSSGGLRRTAADERPRRAARTGATAGPEAEPEEAARSQAACEGRHGG